MLKKISVLTSAVFLLSQLSFATSVTIYNDNLAVIRDTKDINLTKGMQKVEIDNVSANIKPESVIAKFLSDNDKIRICEQNFDYDLVNTNKLLQQYIGNDIDIVKNISDTRKETVRAKLLAVNGGLVVQTARDGKIVLNPEGEISLPKLPEDVRLKPTLSWLIDSEVLGAKKLEYAYQTTGISWNADYNIVLGQNDDKIDFNGWVTINNYSGATYKDADLKLVAGDVNIVKENNIKSMKLMRVQEAACAGFSADEAFQERALFEYYLYSLNGKTTVKNNEKKQIQLIESENIPVEKKYVYESSVNPEKVSSILSFVNNKDSNLGRALPKGTVKVYKNDGSMLEFIGENKIGHTPENKTVILNIGNAFDITASRTQLEYVKASASSYQETISIEISNAKENEVEVEVKEKLSSSNWRITEISDKYEKINSNTISFKIKVPAKGSYKVVYTVKYNA